MGDNEIDQKVNYVAKEAYHQGFSNKDLETIKKAYKYIQSSKNCPDTCEVRTGISRHVDDQDCRVMIKALPEVCEYSTGIRICAQACLVCEIYERCDETRFKN